jgi:CRP/FNR family transcriptional regulator, cyclic AMP receptor protein
MPPLNADIEERVFPLAVRNGSPRPGRNRVRLFELEPDLLRRTPRDLRAVLTREVTVPVRDVAPGQWQPAISSATGLLCLFVLDGALTRETQLLDQRAVEFLGPGDVLRPIEGTAWASLPYSPSLRAVVPSRIALLGEGFEANLPRMPGVAGQLEGRAIQRARTLGLQMAIVGIPKLRLRILAMLWHLADRWGRRENGAVIVDLPLHHAVLADLVRASRPRVTERLGELCDDGLLERRGSARWALFGSPPGSDVHLKGSPPLTFSSVAW